MSTLHTAIQVVLEKYKKQNYVTSQFSSNKTDASGSISVEFTSISRTYSEINLRFYVEDDHNLIIDKLELFGNDHNERNMEDEYFYQEGIKILLQVAKEIKANTIYFEDVSTLGLDEEVEKFGFERDHDTLPIYVLPLKSSNYFSSQEIIPQFSLAWNEHENDYKDLLLNFFPTKPSIGYYFHGVEGELSVILRENDTLLIEKETKEEIVVSDKIDETTFRSIQETLEEIASSKRVELLINPPRKHFDKLMSNLGYSSKVGNSVLELLAKYISPVDFEAELLRDATFKHSYAFSNLTLLQLHTFYFVIRDFIDCEVHLFQEEDEAIKFYQQKFLEIMEKLAAEKVKSFKISKENFTKDNILE